MNVDLEIVANLRSRADGIGRAETPAEVFKLLLEGARSGAPRVSLFLVRKSGSRGWGSSGYDEKTAAALRGHSETEGHGWIGRVAAGEAVLHESDPPADPLGLGRLPAADVAGIPIRVRSRPLAVIVAERFDGEEPWVPDALSILVGVATLRLELLLAWKKLESPAPREVVTGAGAASNELTPAPGFAADGDPETRSREMARRFARLVATDIQLYNEEAVQFGRRQGDLAQRLGGQLERGTKTFLDRHGDLGPAGLRILHEEYVAVLAGGDERLLPFSELD